MKRLLTIGHSYVVAQNRRLAHEMAVQGAGRWDVTAAAPARFAGDLRALELEPIAGEACRVVALPVRFDRVPQLMMYGSGLRRLLAQEWDVVHCWEEPYVAAAFQIARGIRRTPRLVFASFQNISKRYPPPFNWFERYLVRRSAGWIAFGGTIAETLASRNGYSGRPSRVIPPGVDVERFAPDAAARARVRRRFGWDDGVPVVGFVGRFVEAKGVRLLTSLLQSLGTPWRALFVGNGPERQHVQAFAAAHQGRVAVITDATHDDVPAYLNAMDVLCAPSQTTAKWREQFGRMSIEAMACGVPVVASDSGEIARVLADAGVVVCERDESAWRSVLEALLNDGARRQALADKGIVRARQSFAWPIVAARHLEFFEEVSR